MNLITLIDQLLPQTQCTKCGHNGCKPYAEAIAEGHEAINKCPPGGEETIQALAALLDKSVIPLEAEKASEPEVAFIREAECIGCTKCIQACPVDAIVGAAKLMHTVITAECTGCDLCVEPCPVDCIEMRPLPKELTALTGDINLTEVQRKERQLRRNHARQRFEFRNKRLKKEREKREALRGKKIAEVESKQQSQTLIEKITAQRNAGQQPLTAEQKKLKVEAAMIQVTLKKAEKQLQQYNTDELREQVALLRKKLEEANRKLQNA